MERAKRVCEGCGNMIEASSEDRCGVCLVVHYYPVWYRRVVMPQDCGTRGAIQELMKPKDANYVI